MKKIYKIFAILIILSLILSNLSFGYYPDTEYVWSESTVQTSSDGDSENTEQENSDFLDLAAESAILIEQTTGTILYEKNSHEQLYPASVTKIMTILLIMEAIDSRSNYI